jgi:hypothetical protein
MGAGKRTNTDTKSQRERKISSSSVLRGHLWKKKKMVLKEVQFI